ncbi:hypothetical protein [Alicyclobacillus fodiniaquatilis]|uniref:TadE-like protein n=1 Tax=Alicyclobacillus fodiniaquatilis TaxID=1661150 RepID=A0ABW4JI89_9BACL
MRTGRKFRLPRWLSKRHRGDLEDITIFYVFFLPLSLVLLMFGQELLKVHNAYKILYNAAEEACESGATQATYVPNTVPTGSGFQATITQDTAQEVTLQNFQDYVQSMGLDTALNIVSTNVTFPTLNTEKFQVSATYEPDALFQAVNAVNSMLGGSDSTPSGSYVFNVAPTEQLQGSTMGGN